MALITEHPGDIFAAPAHSILIHACNARGAWGSGVALAFKRQHPSAFLAYKSHCLSPPPTTSSSSHSVKQHQASIVGTALLIPPPTTTTTSASTSTTTSTATSTTQQQTPHYIACLFTSLDYGARVSPASEILQNTSAALADLARQIGEMREAGKEVGACYAVRINSGKFGVEWWRTRKVLEAEGLDVTVLRPVAEEEEEEAGDGVGKAVGEGFGGRVVRGGGVRGSGLGEVGRGKGKGKGKGMLGGQGGGVKKRKLEVGRDGDDKGDRENAKEGGFAGLHPGIAKRKKLGLDG